MKSLQVPTSSSARRERLNQCLCASPYTPYTSYIRKKDPQLLRGFGPPIWESHPSETL
jgi:hypothetical protein